MLCCFHAVSWYVLGKLVSCLALWAYCATDLNLESHGSGSSCWPFPSCLLINLHVSTAVSAGRMRLKQKAFQPWLILLRRWQHALLELHRDHLGYVRGCGFWWLWSLDWTAASEQGHEQWNCSPTVKTSVSVRRKRALGRFRCRLSFPRHSPQQGCARATAA